jgi:hypothetical protein
LISLALRVAMRFDLSDQFGKPSFQQSSILGEQGILFPHDDFPKSGKFVREFTYDLFPGITVGDDPEADIFAK